MEGEEVREDAEAAAGAAAAAAAAAMAEGRAVPLPVVWGGGDFDLFLRQVEEVLEKAWEVRLGTEEEVSELSCACVEAVYFDLQQLLECLAGHLKVGLRRVGSEEGVRKVGKAVEVYERGVEVLNEYVARHKGLVEGQGVVMVPMAVLALGTPPRVPSIEMVGPGGEDEEEERRKGKGKGEELKEKTGMEEKEGGLNVMKKKLVTKKRAGREEEEEEVAGKAGNKKRGESSGKKKSRKPLTDKQPAVSMGLTKGKKRKKQRTEKE